MPATESILVFRDRIWLDIYGAVCKMIDGGIARRALSVELLVREQQQLISSEHL